MTTVDLDRVAAVLAEVAEAEILPRWRNLGTGDIREKTGPNDLVMVADEAAERAIGARLPDLLPGSIQIGEEAVERDPGLLDLVKGDRPVWIVDPIDGTKNFAEGSDRFGVMVALVEREVTIAAVIYEPVTGRALMAEAGGGAELVTRDGDRRRLRVADPAGLDTMEGSFNFRFIPDEGIRKAIRANAEDLLPKRHHRRGCAAYDYRKLATGDWHFAFYLGAVRAPSRSAAQAVARELAAGLVAAGADGGAVILKAAQAPSTAEGRAAFTAWACDLIARHAMDAAAQQYDDELEAAAMASDPEPEIEAARVRAAADALGRDDGDAIVEAADRMIAPAGDLHPEAGGALLAAVADVLERHATATGEHDRRLEVGAPPRQVIALALRLRPQLRHHEPAHCRRRREIEGEVRERLGVDRFRALAVVERPAAARWPRAIGRQAD